MQYQCPDPRRSSPKADLPLSARSSRQAARAHSGHKGEYLAPRNGHCRSRTISVPSRRILTHQLSRGLAVVRQARAFYGLGAAV
jgi:hypothetical protein